MPWDSPHAIMTFTIIGSVTKNCWKISGNRNLSLKAPVKLRSWEGFYFCQNYEFSSSPFKVELSAANKGIPSRPNY